VKRKKCNLCLAVNIGYDPTCSEFEFRVNDSRSYPRVEFGLMKW
jgi:hypothetical protein